MKTLHFLLAAAALAACLSCSKSQALQTEVRDYADSTAHSYLTMHAELPIPADAASKAIRKSLIDMMDSQLSQIAPGEPQRYFPPFEGNPDDTEALLGYYKDQTLAQIGKLSQDDADERERYVREDEELSEEQKAEILSNIPSWGYDFKLEKIIDTTAYVVFQSLNYIYMGGAHGGVTGEGFLTFDKKTGQQVKQMLDPACVGEIQPLLIKGLTGYYAECGYQMSEEELKQHLMLEGDLIPLPAWALYPTTDGLNFVYQQYEIASYADGMPSFTLPVEDVQAWLTPEAKAILNR